MTATACKPRSTAPDIKLLTRTGFDWSHRYWRTMEALGFLKVKLAESTVSCALSTAMACRCSAAFRRRSDWQIIAGRTLASASIMVAVVWPWFAAEPIRRLENHLSAFRAT
jgi:hypothetical protein